MLRMYEGKWVFSEQNFRYVSWSKQMSYADQTVEKITPNVRVYSGITI